jgi:uncharacterized protein (TIGR00251 family)
LIPIAVIQSVKIKPGAKVNRFEKDAEGLWVFKIKAPPVDGKANEALIKFISDKLRIPKSSIEILSGHSGKFKRISIEGVAKEKAEKDLLAD